MMFSALGKNSSSNSIMVIEVNSKEIQRVGLRGHRYILYKPSYELGNDQFIVDCCHVSKELSNTCLINKKIRFSLWRLNG